MVMFGFVHKKPNIKNQELPKHTPPLTATGGFATFLSFLRKCLFTVHIRFTSCLVLSCKSMKCLRDALVAGSHPPQLVDSEKSEALAPDLG